MSNETPWSTFIKTPQPQSQDTQPGMESVMQPRPVFQHKDYNKSSGRLQDKVAIITGGDSGIGRAVSVAYASEGAKVVIVYYNEHDDANETKSIIEAGGGQCLLLSGDIANSSFSDEIVQKTLATFGQINILVNNAAVHYEHQNFTDTLDEDILKTFATNIFGPMYLSRAVIPHLQAGDSIINTTSVTAYEGNATLIDYSATKGALTSFTRSLSAHLASKQIRVNAVAPGPIWTPLIPAAFEAQHVAQHGANTPLGRVGQPVELAGAYVYLASNDASYISGITIHINGGTIINC
ncbi:MAG TPA: NAD(P)-dependent oxidoreductase [Firmicutes bacterium]|nr:NAD(P)-dependent oxidoreductase [Bacillota bacterium]